MTGEGFSRDTSVCVGLKSARRDRAVVASWHLLAGSLPVVWPGVGWLLREGTHGGSAMTKILLIDDEAAILEVLRTFLDAMGYEVRTALNGACLGELGNPLPDLVLLDVRLAQEDGRELCRRLKSGEQTRHLPVFLLSAYVGDPETLRSCGADEFVPKPFRLWDLRQLITSYLPSEGI